MCHIYFQLVCQKLCQNKGSGWGSLEESNSWEGPVRTAFFPTSLCGVLVFGSVSRPPPSARLPPPHTQLTHIQLTHTHNLHTHTQVTHTQLAHTQLAHTHNLLTHTTYSHKTCTHTHYSHTHTTCSHTQLVHTQPTHTQLAHTCSETSLRITDVECIGRAKTTQLNLTGEMKKNIYIGLRWPPAATYNCAQVHHRSPAGTFTRVPGRCLRWSPTPPGPRWPPAN